MKKTALLLFFALVFTLLVTPTSGASVKTMLSPALEVISNRTAMIKSGVVTGNIALSREDFEKAVGAKVDSVTITALPAESAGILVYNGTAVAVNQTISSGGLNEIKYVPSGVGSEGSFRFKTSGGYSIECQLKYTDTINLAPSAALNENAMSVWTQTDIEAFGKLSGSDPEGDAVVFEITSYPTKGILDLRSSTSGEYSYTPCNNATGKDEFTYVVRDEWGHYSEPSTVVIEIEKAASDIRFDDMEGHWAHNAAVVMASAGAMKYEENGITVLFNPDKAITREEFLTTTMKILGAGEIEPAVTIFADNDKISDDASGYVARAYSLGIINGTEKNGLKYFEPASTITRAEAAVILNKIIGAAEPDTVPVFADAESVPAWARGSLYALTNEGILSGTGAGKISPNEPLSRAQAAQILLKVKKMYS